MADGVQIQETQHLLMGIDSMEYKGYEIVGDGSYGYKSIKPIGRGSVPKQLRGLYTTAQFAQKDIDAHIEGSGKNGKAEIS